MHAAGYLIRLPVPDIENGFLELFNSGLRKCVLQKIIIIIKEKISIAKLSWLDNIKATGTLNCFFLIARVAVR